MSESPFSQEQWEQLIDASGVTPDNLPTTPEEFAAAADRMRAAIAGFRPVEDVDLVGALIQAGEQR